MAAKININMVAKEAGVSTTTVSNFVNCSESLPIGEGKQRRILEVMRKYNYRANSAGGTIRRAKTLPGKGVFVYGNYPVLHPFVIVNNMMLKKTLLELSLSLKKSLGMSLEIRSVVNEVSIPEWNELLLEAGFVINYGRLNPRLYMLCYRKNIPLVLISESEEILCNEPLETEIDASCVYWDSKKHSTMLLEYLAAKGVRKTLYVSSWNVRANRDELFAIEAQKKIDGYLEFIHENRGFSGEVLISPIPQDKNEYYEIRNVYELLNANAQSLSGVQAILGHNDIVAQGVIAAVRDKGLVPGKDIFVTGEGDYLEYANCFPAITTITYDRLRLAEEVCHMLKSKLERISCRQEKVLIESKLIIRETA